MLAVENVARARAPGPVTGPAYDRDAILLRAYPQPPAWTIPLPVRKNIRITNPISGPGFTSLNRARRFVKRGMAEWVELGTSIRFIRDPRDHRDIASPANRLTGYWYERAAHEGVADLAALANTPVVAPAKLLKLGRRKGASRHTFLAAQGLA